MQGLVYFLPSFIFSLFLAFIFPFSRRIQGHTFSMEANKERIGYFTCFSFLSLFLYACGVRLNIYLLKLLSLSFQFNLLFCGWFTYFFLVHFFSYASVSFFLCPTPFPFRYLANFLFFHINKRALEDSLDRGFSRSQNYN